MALLVAAGWIGLSLAVSSLGWARWAAAYEHDGPAPPTRFRFRSAGFRWGAGYNRSVHFAVDGEALYLWVVPWLRIGHPRLRIPWEDLRFRPARAGWVRRVDLESRRVPRPVLRITPKLAAELAAAVPGVWPAEGADG